MVVVKALSHSSWGMFTIIVTVPAALLTGAWMYKILRNTFLTSRTGLKAGMTLSLDTGTTTLEIAKAIVQVKDAGQKVAVVPGPALIHSGADQYLIEILRLGVIDVLLQQGFLLEQRIVICLQ